MAKAEWFLRKATREERRNINLTEAKLTEEQKDHHFSNLRSKFINQLEKSPEFREAAGKYFLTEITVGKSFSTNNKTVSYELKDIAVVVYIQYPNLQAISPGTIIQISPSFRGIKKEKLRARPTEVLKLFPRTEGSSPIIRYDGKGGSQQNSLMAVEKAEGMLNTLKRSARKFPLSFPSK